MIIYGTFGAVSKEKELIFMRYSYNGKNIDITENFRAKIENKLNRISKLFTPDTEVTVSLSVIKLDNKAEVTVKLPKRILRAEVVRDDMMAAIDEVVDILEGQMTRYKSRLKDKSRRDGSFVDELNALISDDDQVEEDGLEIVRTKHFTVKPMDAEEAVMEMELLGHNFFVFRNASTDEINVVYKRKDGAYGLIEPEY